MIGFINQMENKPHQRDFALELNFTASKSGGPGGQGVNKVNTKVTLRFAIEKSQLLSQEEKEIIRRKLVRKINNEDEIVVYSDSERSQLKNREEVVNKFRQLLIQAFTVRKKRKSTKPTKASIQKRLKEKQVQSEKKQNRQKLDF